MGSGGGSGTGTGTGSGTAGGGSTGGPDSNTVQKGIRPAIILYSQGIGLMHAKKFAEAQAKFEQAITENPNFAESHNYLGYSLQMEGPQHYSVALEHYNKAIQLKPNLAEAYEYRGVLLLRMGRKTAAEKDLATLKTLRPKLATELERVIKAGRNENKSAMKQSGTLPE